MKLISYSLFISGAEPFEMDCFVRGFYWNARMNSLIYPDFQTHLDVDVAVYMTYRELFDWLVQNNRLSLVINQIDRQVPLCEGMLWRMKPMFMPNVSHVLCRDSDAITTYREAQLVQRWLESGLQFHSIHDNPGHSGLMGGMIGFNTAYVKAVMGWHSWDDIIRGRDLSQRGSDQDLLNQAVLPMVRDGLMTHNAQGMTENPPLPQVETYGGATDGKNYWESNLTCRHIGSAGVVEMETIRFFRRHDIYDWKFRQIEKQFPKLFYWWL